MSSVSVNVDVDISEFSDSDLVDEIKYRNLENEFVKDVDLGQFSDEQIIQYFTEQGYTVFTSDRSKSIEELYSSYMTTNFIFFQKELKKFFEKELGVMI
jgi:hypothetical protein